MQDIIEEGNPKIGIFEFIDEKFYILSRNIDFSRAKDLSDDAGEFFHETLVRGVISSCSEKAQETYHSVTQGFLLFPRGRVCYDFQDKKYRVFGERTVILNSDLRQKVSRLFYLPLDQTAYCLDPYYEIGIR